jgi:L-rhamnose isomerase
MGHRRILMESLDDILEKEYSAAEMKDAVEAKLFGIGSEAYVVGSHDFYLGYAISRGKIPCIDMGHFHPTELVADKISSILLFSDELLLHISRPMRWDSDHVVILNDELHFLAEELVRCGKIDKVYLGLDFFDASINRLGAWAVGARATLQALLKAFLQPHDRLLAYEEEGNNFARLALLENLKILPFGAVWDHYCSASDVVLNNALIDEVGRYEQDVQSKRA